MVLLPTEELKEKISKVFEKYDVNKDGQIDKQELIKMMKSANQFDRDE